MSGDAQMYAPFACEKGDTQKSVEKRVLAFYNSRLFAISQPPRRAGGWGGQQRPPTAPAVPVPTEEATS